MDHLHQPMIVAIIHGYANEHGPLHRKGLLKRGPDLIGTFYL